MSKHKIYKIGATAEIALGKELEKLRKAKGVTRPQLGRMINVTERQIAKYESGEFIPIPVLEEIADALGERIPKREIRRISFVRKLEIETGKEQKELVELYQALFELHDDEE